MSKRTDGVYKDYSKIAGMDPAANFLLGPGWHAFSGGEIDPVLQFIILPSAEFLQVFAARQDDAAWRGFLIPGRSKRVLAPGQPVSALTTRSFLDQQIAIGVDSAFLRTEKKLQLCLPLPRRLFAAIPGEGALELAEPPVFTQRNWKSAAVVGIIDDGIAFGHERFRRNDGTSRFEYFWHQDGLPRGPGQDTVEFGREFGKAEIDLMLQASRVPGVGVEETKLYRMAGMADYRQPGHKSVAWRLAHGTHVLDLAAGYPSSDDVADRPLIGVQLPVAATANMSGAGLEQSVLSAILYILSRAALLTPQGSAPLPVTINFSYGTYLGPHNGTALLELAMDLLIKVAAVPVQIVLPAGNSNLVRCHAEPAPPKGGTEELGVRVQPDSKTITTIQVWLPSGGGPGPRPSRVAIMAVSPNGDTSGWIEEGSTQDVTLPSGASLAGVSVPNFARVAYHFCPLLKQGHFRIDIQPTSWDLPGGPTDPAVLKAPAGVWKIILKNRDLPVQEALQCWIERNDLLYGYPRRGRQAYFEASEFKRFDDEGRQITDDAAPAGPIRRVGMENAIGTADGPMVLGGFTRKDRTIADYSAGGPALPPEKPFVRPDALAVTDDSRVHAGVLAAGTRSGSVLPMRGTSVAAPQVTRLVSAELAAGRPFDRLALITRAKADDPGGNPTLPPARSGAGRLDLPNSTKRPDRFQKG